MLHPDSCGAVSLLQRSSCLSHRMCWNGGGKHRVTPAAVFHMLKRHEPKLHRLDAHTSTWPCLNMQQGTTASAELIHPVIMPREIPSVLQSRGYDEAQLVKCGEVDPSAGDLLGFGWTVQAALVEMGNYMTSCFSTDYNEWTRSGCTKPIKVIGCHRNDFFFCHESIGFELLVTVVTTGCDMAELVSPILSNCQVVHRYKMPQNMAWKLSCLGLGA